MVVPRFVEVNAEVWNRTEQNGMGVQKETKTGERI